MNDYFTSGVHSAATFRGMMRNHILIHKTHFHRIILVYCSSVLSVHIHFDYIPTIDLKYSTNVYKLFNKQQHLSTHCTYMQQSPTTGVTAFARRKANQLQGRLCSANHENATSHHANRRNRCYFTPNEPCLLGAQTGVTSVY